MARYSINLFFQQSILFERFLLHILVVGLFVCMTACTSSAITNDPAPSVTIIPTQSEEPGDNRPGTDTQDTIQTAVTAQPPPTSQPPSIHNREFEQVSSTDKTEQNQNEDTAENKSSDTSAQLSNEENVNGEDMTDENIVLMQMEMAPVVLSYENLNPTSPSDIFREIAYSGGMGGGGDPCDGAPSNIPSIDLVRWVHNFVTEFDSFEWLDSFSIFACGLPANIPIQISLLSPNEDIVYETSDTTSLSGGLYFGYEIEINTLPGLYTLLLKGDSVNLEQQIEIVVPSEPRLYPIDNGHQFILYNFEPNERIRVFVYGKPPNKYVYENLADFIGWQEYNVDSVGQLILEVDQSIYNISYGSTIFFVRDGGNEKIDFFPPAPDHSISIVLSHFPILVTRPDNNVFIDSIWTLVNFLDLKQPGMQTYDIDISSTDLLKWNFLWCAKSSDLLKEIVRPLELSFLINDTPVSWPQLLVADFSHNSATNDWHCQEWSTILTNFPIDETVELEIHYTLETAIFDGEASYPPGEYRHLIHVTGKE